MGNRVVKFRGKRVGNGEWVYGWYVKANGHWNNKGIHEDWIICHAIQNGGWFVLGEKHPVIPETVGQYTGLKDRNVKEVYEGDIVEFEDSDGGYEYQDLVINTGVVEYEALGFYFTDRVAVGMAIEALERQIPAKPTYHANKITVDIQFRPLLDDLEVNIDDIKEYISKLKENEQGEKK